MGTSVVLFDSAVGVHSVADVGAAFESGIQTQEQVDTVKVFHFMHPFNQFVWSSIVFRDNSVALKIKQKLKVILYN